MFNYHELTMHEPRDSPAKKQQFKVICLVMATCICYAAITSGALRPVVVEEGVFPGGEFIYKITGRDYAASMSLIESIGSDLKLRDREFGNVLYTLYLDDPLMVSGRRQRFASGLLLNDGTVTGKHSTNSERRAVLLDKNSQIKPPTKVELEDMAAHSLWPRLPYHFQELPTTKAAIVEYKFTNGFVSALLHSYRVFPAIRQYAKEHGAIGISPVVMTTCSVVDQKCTHYVPLADTENIFRLGKPEYSADDAGGVVNWVGVRNMLLKVLSFGQMGGAVEMKREDVMAVHETMATTILKSQEGGSADHTADIMPDPTVEESSKSSQQPTTYEEPPDLPEPTDKAETTHSDEEALPPTEESSEPINLQDDVAASEQHHLEQSTEAADNVETKSEAEVAEEMASENPPAEESAESASVEEATYSHPRDNDAQPASQSEDPQVEESSATSERDEL